MSEKGKKKRLNIFAYLYLSFFFFQKNLKKSFLHERKKIFNSSKTLGSKRVNFQISKINISLHLKFQMVKKDYFKKDMQTHLKKKELSQGGERWDNTAHIISH